MLKEWVSQYIATDDGHDEDEEREKKRSSFFPLSPDKIWQRKECESSLIERKDVLSELFYHIWTLWTSFFLIPNPAFSDKLIAITLFFFSLLSSQMNEGMEQMLAWSQGCMNLDSNDGERRRGKKWRIVSKKKEEKKQRIRGGG